MATTTVGPAEIAVAESAATPATATDDTSPTVPASALLRPVAAGAALFVLILCLRLALDYRSGADPESRAFARRLDYDVWTVLLAGTVTLWITMSVVLWSRLRSTYGRLGVAPLSLALTAYAVVAGIMLFLLSNAEGANTGHNPLWAAQEKISAALVVIVIAAAPVAVGLWFGQAYLVALRSSMSSGHRPAAWQREAQQLLKVYDFTKASLVVASTGITAAVVTTGALRNALVEAGLVTDEQFPPSYLLLYGGFFSLVFAAVFLPALMEWRGVARRLVEAVCPLPDDASQAEEWTRCRATMQEVLHLDVSVTKTLTSAFGILAPLGTSALAVFVPQLAG